MSDGIGRIGHSGWTWYGGMVCLTLSVVLLLLNSFGGRDPSPVGKMFREELSGTELDQAPGPAGRVPHGDIQTVFKVFKVRLMAEAPGFPIEAMEKTSAWAELQQTVAAYDQEVERTRREVVEEKLRMSDLLWSSYVHSTRRSMRMSWFAIFSLFGAIAFMVLDAISTQRAIAEL